MLPTGEETVPSSAPTWRPAVTVAAAVAAIVVLVAAGSTVADRLPDAVGHGLGHLLPALPLGLLLLAVLRRWPPARATRPGGAGRRLVVVGLGGVVAGQVLEVLGARVDEPDALLAEGIAHTAGQIVTMLSLPFLLAGAVASLVAAAREGAVPWWVAGVVAAGGAGLFMLMMVGPPDGN